MVAESIFDGSRNMDHAETKTVNNSNNATPIDFAASPELILHELLRSYPGNTIRDEKADIYDKIDDNSLLANLKEKELYGIYSFAIGLANGEENPDDNKWIKWMIKVGEVEQNGEFRRKTHWHQYGGGGDRLWSDLIRSPDKRVAEWRGKWIRAMVKVAGLLPLVIGNLTNMKGIGAEVFRTILGTPQRPIRCLLSVRSLRRAISTILQLPLAEACRFQQIVGKVAEP